jgi:hypothetical protein
MQLKQIACELAAKRITNLDFQELTPAIGGNGLIRDIWRRQQAFSI